MMSEEPAVQFDRETLERESDLTFFVAGGPGGQHRNKVATGVRLVHRPSGFVVTATERRSQTANRDMAFARRPSRAKRQLRLAEKQQRASLKQARRPIRDE
jgi:protein subunit release factor B